VINDDTVEFSLQGSTHWDSFAHFGLIEPGHDAVFYGGAGISETYPTGEPEALGIQAFGGAIVTRGVLIDAVAEMEGLGGEFLSPGSAITAEVVERCLKGQNQTLEQGDAVLIYTGFERRFLHDMSLAGTVDGGSVPGIDGSTLRIWRDARIAVLAADNVGLESIPPDFAVHVGALRNLGIPLGEMWALDELAIKCRSDRRYDFLFVSVPLNIPGAFASPANAVAIR
jgi:kynurenine formamidase